MINSSIKDHQNPHQHRIAIIGGRKSGKTTLCASLHQSLMANAHGFSPNMIARFPDAEGLQQIEKLFALKFNAPHTLFRAEQTAPVNTLKIGIDFTSSKWSLFQRKKQHLSGHYAIEISDLRDDFDLFGQFVNHMPQTHSQSQKAQSTQFQTADGQNPLTQFESSLQAANALIICQPAGQKLSPSESTGFIRLMSDIAIGRYGKFETIIIAFTKYESLFLNKGINAFGHAIKPQTILESMLKTILADQSIETGLRALNCHEPDSPHLYAMPVSSFGFMRHNGAANLDKLTGQPISALSSYIEQPRNENPLDGAKAKKKVAGFTIPLSDFDKTQALHPPHPSQHWLPFLTADPFLTAISGLPSQFMIPFDEFLSALDHGTPLQPWRKSA